MLLRGSCCGESLRLLVLEKGATPLLALTVRDHRPLKLLDRLFHFRHCAHLVRWGDLGVHIREGLRALAVAVFIRVHVPQIVVLPVLIPQSLVELNLSVYLLAVIKLLEILRLFGGPVLLDAQVDQLLGLLAREEVLAGQVVDGRLFPF